MVHTFVSFLAAHKLVMDQQSRQQALRAYCSNIHTVMKGLVDIALLTANANQLRHVIQLENEAMRILNIVLISLSITLQVDL